MNNNKKNNNKVVIRSESDTSQMYVFFKYFDTIKNTFRRFCDEYMFLTK